MANVYNDYRVRPPAVPGHVWIWNQAQGQWLATIPPADNGPRFNLGTRALGMANADPFTPASLTGGNNKTLLYVIGAGVLAYFLFAKK